MPPGVFVTIVVFGTIMSVPLTAIITHHRRKMIELMHGKDGMSSAAEARLTAEISELRQLVAQQAIVVDDLNMMHRRLLERSDEGIRQRLNG